MMFGGPWGPAGRSSIGLSFGRYLLHDLKMSSDDRRSLFQALLGDGRPLLALTGIALFASGGFAILQSLTGHLLPHDSHALGMDAGGLTRAANAQLTLFMFHDRVAFGGTLLAIGAAYWWLSEFPLRAGQAWAWWAFAVSGFTGITDAGSSAWRRIGGSGGAGFTIKATHRS